MQAQVINLFGNEDLCGCGSSVFNNGGGVDLTTIDQTVLTNRTSKSLAVFNPFTTSPVQGTNWNPGPQFGTALNRFAWTNPREFRINLGVRF